MRLRVLIAAGGTGGHIYPGIAVAKELMRRDSASVVRFVGTARGLETRLVPQAGFELSLIESAGLVNMGLAARLRGLMILPKSFVAARRLVREFRPDIVVGAGGYVSGPVLLTAALMHIRTLVMESNAVPGFTNRRLARFVDAAAVSFEAALPYFGGKGVVTGNPVRREFFEVPAKRRDPERFSLLIFGGSQGARAINEAVVAALAHLVSQRGVLHVTHQTGKLDFEHVRDGYNAAGWEERAEVREYIDDMVSAFAASDLIVSRAGATTSFELMAAGKAALMVPLPGQLEQRRNAEVMQESGAARMIPQTELTGERLAQEINALVENPERVTQMEQAARKLARGDAAVATVDLIERLVDSRQ
ncbi:MAG: UDP-N-acetylglucosamine--N-acetylmuramyl-(pentapeptide) pyrophosphoryl-undecaprenol [Acidobacteriota bacterium]|jgi:UDP-N-acetylglucosamine--N-acetylmuramyl-(pentapeptide) pyrophosphoryl-undecaprenol N-acetylglucosamine transferase|nr:UDP-N-acetylglucosamine--N-acetylmuramyl-(pentapeptide) pyrophosphoryl-undecaprenol [Acidobacteriota bacterium]